MGSLYIKGKKLWARFKNEHGKWKGGPTPYRPGDEAKARGFLKRLENQSAAKRSYSERAAEEPKGPITVARYADHWVADRKQIGLATASDDLARLRLHVLPTLGTMALEGVRPRHFRDLVLDLRKQGVLAPRSVRHVYATAACMFRTAVADELIPFTPCVLAKGILPKNVDKDASFRANAIFTREEVQTLISDVRILEDRRVLHALKALAALRHSEASGLRWRQYDTNLEPLGALNLEKTKTQVPRRVPVHPMLARILRDWRDGGWERTYGRAPADDDFIVPTRNMTERLSPEAQNSFRADLLLLGFRHRRGHDLRRTFITLAQVDGARRDLLETITHGPRGNIINVYTTFPWPALSAEVAKLKIRKITAGVTKLGSQNPTSAHPVLDGEPRSLATGLATAQRNWRNRWRKSATPAGFESDRDLTRPHVECENARLDGAFEDATAGHGSPICNDCNEVTPRLARVAKNALLNGDFPRAIEVLDRLSRGWCAEASEAAS